MQSLTRTLIDLLQNRSFQTLEIVKILLPQISYHRELRTKSRQMIKFRTG